MPGLGKPCLVCTSVGSRHLPVAILDFPTLPQKLCTKAWPRLACNFPLPLLFILMRLAMK